MDIIFDMPSSINVFVFPVEWHDLYKKGEKFYLVAQGIGEVAGDMEKYAFRIREQCKRVIFLTRFAPSINHIE